MELIQQQINNIFRYIWIYIKWHEHDNKEEME